MRTLEKPTQRQRILAELRDAGYAGRCLYDIELGLGHKLASRVSDLKADGYVITTHGCRIQHTGPDTPHHTRYWLVSKPVQENLL